MLAAGSFFNLRKSKGHNRWPTSSGGGQACDQPPVLANFPRKQFGRIDVISIPSITCIDTIIAKGTENAWRGRCYAPPVHTEPRLNALSQLSFRVNGACRGFDPK